MPRKEKTTRQKLVKAILYYASDEFEDTESVSELASESEDELLDRVISILDFYHVEYNHQ